MLFKRRFHGPISRGDIQTTFRSWKRPRVKVGKCYRLNSEGVIAIDSVERTSVSAVSESDATASGFESRHALLRELSGSVTLDDDAEVYRVDFQYRASPRDPYEDVSGDIPVEAFESLVAKLDAMDTRAGNGRWTREVLAFIGNNTKTAASALAPSLGTDTQRFKANVRKLKRLGLTISYGTGYGLTSLGARVLEAADR